MFFFLDGSAAAFASCTCLCCSPLLRAPFSRTSPTAFTSAGGFLSPALVCSTESSARESVCFSFHVVHLSLFQACAAVDDILAQGWDAALIIQEVSLRM